MTRKKLPIGIQTFAKKQHQQFDSKIFLSIEVKDDLNFVNTIREKVAKVDDWLASAKLSAQLRNYPDSNGDIFAWHGDIRRKHAKQRRS